MSSRLNILRIKFVKMFTPRPGIEPGPSPRQGDVLAGKLSEPKIS